MNQVCVCPGRRQHKSLLWGVRWPQYGFLPPIRSDKKEEREPEAVRGVELLCNYNMVLKSKYQTLATSARRQREKKGGGKQWRGGVEKNRQGELRSAIERDPAMTSALQQSSPASWSQG